MHNTKQTNKKKYKNKNKIALHIDTSESLNFISPSATREDFTAGIAERVRKIQTTQPLTPKLILNQSVNQRTATTTTCFDINSGKISTIVSRVTAANISEANGCFFNGNTEKFLSTKTIELQSPTVVAHANKKPSYLSKSASIICLWSSCVKLYLL